MKDSKYYKKYFKGKENSNKSWLSKILICVIILLLCLIVTNFNKDFKDKFVNKVLEDNLDFTKISKVYDKFVGENKEKDREALVSSTGSIMDMEKEEYNGSYKVKVDLEYPIHLINSGIIVYIGDKDEYKSTVIVQGNDGVDIWYSNIIISDYSLYDYVKKDEIIGTSNSDEIIITMMRDGKKLSYEEYFG